MEHNFGHGKNQLSAPLATMNLLAFWLHMLLEITDKVYQTQIQLLREKIGARLTFFDPIRTLTTYLDFANWEHLMDFLMRGQKVDPYKEEDVEKTENWLAGLF